MARSAGLAVCFVLLAFSALVQAQTPFSTLLFTSANITNDEYSSTQYASCEAENSLTDVGTPLSTDQLNDTQVDARWFGGSTVPASSFDVQDCSMLKLLGGRSVNVVSVTSTDTQTETCQVQWYVTTDYVTVVVNITTDDAYWSVSLPTTSSAITQTSCYGTRTQCLLASTTPCNNVNLGAGFASYTATGSSAGTCPVGEYSEDYLNSVDLVYGLKASFYPMVFNCSNPDSATQYTAPNLTTLAPDTQFSRCQDALDYTIPNTTFPSSPALPESEFSSCYAAQLDGYVRVDNYTDLQFLTPEPVPSFYNSYRVCLRFSNIVKLYLNNKLLIQSTTGDYDAVLTCLDIPDLPQGYIPFSLEFASPPNAVDSVILQFYIIPVSQVVTDNRPGETYQVTYKCDCCGLFSASGSCCEPLDTCYFRTPDCGPVDTFPPPPPKAPTPPPLPVVSPPPKAVTPPPSAPKAPAPAPKAVSSPPPPPQSPAPAPKAVSSPPPPPKAPTPAPKAVSSPPPPPKAPAPAPKAVSSPPPTPQAPSPAPKGATPPPPLPVLPPPTPTPSPKSPVPAPNMAPKSLPPPTTPTSPVPAPTTPRSPVPTPSTPSRTPAVAPAPLFGTGPPGATPPRETPPSPLPVGIPPFPILRSPPPSLAPSALCPCDSICPSKPILLESTEVTYQTFKEIVVMSTSWEDLENNMQV